MLFRSLHMKISRNTVAAIAGLSAVLSASAADSLFYGFDTGVSGFTKVEWSQTGPANSTSGAAIFVTNSVGGWRLGSSSVKDFTFEAGEQQVMQALAAGGDGRLSFDILVDGTSFGTVGTANWYQTWIAGNSDGTTGWTQVNAADKWHNAGDTASYVYHVDLAFSQLGWQAGDSWYQIQFGANSEASFPYSYYIDNVTVVPEPSTGLLVLGGLSLLALHMRRRS